MRSKVESRVRSVVVEAGSKERRNDRGHSMKYCLSLQGDGRDQEGPGGLRRHVKLHGCSCDEVSKECP